MDINPKHLLSSLRSKGAQAVNLVAVAKLIGSSKEALAAWAVDPLFQDTLTATNKLYVHYYIE